MTTEEILNKEVIYPPGNHAHNNVVINIGKELAKEGAEFAKEMVPVVSGFVKDAIDHYKEEMIEFAQYKAKNIPYEKVCGIITDNKKDHGVFYGIFERKKIDKETAVKFVKEGGIISEPNMDEIEIVRPDIIQGCMCNCNVPKIQITDFLKMSIPISGSLI
jgi:hypothetical protein